MNDEIKSRKWLFLTLAYLMIFTSGCYASLTNITATNPRNDSRTICDTQGGTPCNISLSGEVMLAEYNYLCLYGTVNSDNPDWWKEGGGPTETTPGSEIWSMVTFGVGSENRLRLIPFSLTVLYSNQRCVPEHSEASQ
jgi:hypothetical protein